MAGRILALDIATATGVAEGAPGEQPTLRSVRFGEQGASLEASFAAAIAWTEQVLQERRPGMIVFEAPLAPSFMRGHTSANTIRKLMGLAAVITGTAHRHGFYNIREATVSDIRRHFLGRRRLRSAEAKKATIARCRELGLNPKNHNESDAAALWFYAAGLHPAEPALL